MWKFSALHCAKTLFADDTRLFYECNEPDCETSVIDKSLIRVRTWCSFNKLTLNVDKTSILVIKNWQNNLDLTDQVHINNISIAKTTDIKFLSIQS